MDEIETLEATEARRLMDDARAANPSADQLLLAFDFVQLFGALPPPLVCYGLKLHMMPALWALESREFGTVPIRSDIGYWVNAIHIH